MSYERLGLWQCEKHGIVGAPPDRCSACVGEEQRALDLLRKIGQELLTQNNLCTADPIWVVYQRDRVYGIDTSLTDDHVYLDDEYEELTDRDFEEYLTDFAEDLMEYAEDNGYDEIDRDVFLEFLTSADGDGDSRFNITKTGYVDKDRFVTACFTRKEAERYIAENAHNLKQPFVFAAGGYRNKEWIALRAALMDLAR